MAREWISDVAGGEIEGKDTVELKLRGKCQIKCAFISPRKSAMRIIL